MTFCIRFIYYLDDILIHLWINKACHCKCVIIFQFTYFSKQTEVSIIYFLKRDYVMNLQKQSLFMLNEQNVSTACIVDRGFSKVSQQMLRGCGGIDGHNCAQFAFCYACLRKTSKVTTLFVLPPSFLQVCSVPRCTSCTIRYIFMTGFNFTQNPTIWNRHVSQIFHNIN